MSRLVAILALLCVPAFGGDARPVSLNGAAFRVWCLEVNNYPACDGQSRQTQVILRREGGAIAQWHLRGSAERLPSGLWYIHDHSTCCYVYPSREIYTYTDVDVEVEERWSLPVEYRVPYTHDARYPWEVGR